MHPFPAVAGIGKAPQVFQRFRSPGIRAFCRMQSVFHGSDLVPGDGFRHIVADNLVKKAFSLRGVGQDEGRPPVSAEKRGIVPYMPEIRERDVGHAVVRGKAALVAAFPGNQVPRPDRMVRKVGAGLCANRSVLEMPDGLEIAPVTAFLVAVFVSDGLRLLPFLQKGPLLAQKQRGEITMADKVDGEKVFRFPASAEKRKESGDLAGRSGVDDALSRS